MKSLCLLFCVCLLSTLSPVFGQAQEKGGSISDVGFIEGSWKAVAGNRKIDAVWSASAPESIVGFVRVTRDDKVVLYELFAFEQSEQGLVALVRHFSPGLVAQEEKETPNRYHFLEAENGRALFQRQGQEVRVRYEKRSDDEFAIVIGRPQDGEWVFKDFWVFSRVK